MIDSIIRRSCIRRCPIRGFASGRLSKRCSSSSCGDGRSSLTPEEAGRKAAAMATTLVDGDASSSQLAASTVMAHAGIQHNIQNAPMAPPIQFASTYTRPADGIYLPGDTTYSRADNPTRLLLEQTIFELECLGGETSQEQKEELSSTFAFSSGMMAVTAIVLAHASPLTVFIPEDVYHGVPTVLTDVFERHGVRMERIDMTDLAKIQEAVEQSTNTDNDVIVWMETPSNPKCQVVDIRGVCEALKHHDKVTTVVDGTMTSPVITRPLEVSFVSNLCKLSWSFFLIPSIQDQSTYTLSIILVGS